METPTPVIEPVTPPSTAASSPSKYRSPPPNYHTLTPPPHPRFRDEVFHQKMGSAQVIMDPRRHNLLTEGPRIFLERSFYTVVMPLGNFWGRCLVDSRCTAPPTHLLLLSNVGIPYGDRTCFPIHFQVYATYCKTFTLLPPVQGFAVSRNELDLPVVYLTVPSLNTFHILHQFLYTRDYEQLIYQLLGITPKDALLPPTPVLAERVAGAFASTNFEETEMALTGRIRMVHGVKNNAMALGMVAPEDQHFYWTLWYIEQLIWKGVDLTREQGAKQVGKTLETKYTSENASA
ncbi:hypothetical protein FRB99_001234 [Tulasnella sp. 403]|nr:hypothetical protein FRB99_001234 [Tulasnella sp. 403]